jgi:hypothetical protein
VDTLAAMANTYGGVVLVGVGHDRQYKNRPRTVVGVPPTGGRLADSVRVDGSRSPVRLALKSVASPGPIVVGYTQRKLPAPVPLTTWTMLAHSWDCRQGALAQRAADRQRGNTWATTQPRTKDTEPANAAADSADSANPVQVRVRQSRRAAGVPSPARSRRAGVIV